MGRPSSYRVETAEAICQRIAEGEALKAICQDEGMPDRVTVRRWLVKNAAFRIMFARAKEEQADVLAEEVLGLSDEPPQFTTNKFGDPTIDPAWVTWQNNRVATRKWIASKLKPGSYGDRVEQNHTGTVALQHEAIDRPPVETREQWIARRQRELDTARLALGAPAGSAD